MTSTSLAEKARTYLQRLCLDIPNRRVGSTGNQDGNWLQPAWEYMHTHPSLDEASLDRIGIWESAGDIVGVAHPDFRRMGLGKAAVWEGIRRCALLGATVAYVGSDQAFYKAIGFTKRFDSNSWIRHF